jgi:hypothetical protein
LSSVYRHKNKKTSTMTERTTPTTIPTQSNGQDNANAGISAEDLAAAGPSNAAAEPVHANYGDFDLAQQILFAGEDRSKVQGSLSAKDFVAAIENKKLKNRWDERQAAGYTISCLRGEAAEWYRTLNQWVPPEVLAMAAINYGELMTLFARRYKAAPKASAATTVTLDLKSQQKGETTYRYTLRILGAFAAASNPESFQFTAPDLPNTSRT